MAASISAQTVKPVIAELGNPAKGRIEYYNDSLTPLNVVLEPKASPSPRPAKSATARSIPPST